MIEILVYLSSMVTFFWVGYQTGNKMPRPEAKISSVNSEEIFKKGYIKGYGDAYTSLKGYDKFPPMGTN